MSSPVPQNETSSVPSRSKLDNFEIQASQRSIESGALLTNIDDSKFIIKLDLDHISSAQNETEILVASLE